MQETERQPPIEIPQDQISLEALQAIVESFVLREGTDYGFQEVSHEKKMGQIRKQIENGEVKIVFDPNSESVTLMTKHDFLKLKI